jgi:pimeloyl-ACP methyl ester carboxylesterase
MTLAWRTGTVASGGESIYFECTGDDDAPAVLLTHGAGGSHAAWFQQVPALCAAGYRAITWDCRGFGNSTFDSGEHGCDTAVADMTAVLDELRVDAAHVVGQSMGGWWVTAFAQARPDRTRSLTLTNTIGGLWTDAILEHFRQSLTNAAAGEPGLGVHPALSPKFAQRDPAGAFLYQQLNTFHSPPMAAIGKALTGTTVDPPDLDALDIPMLLIVGVDDTLFPPPLVIESVQRCRRAQVAEIADAGHSAYFERPDEFNAALVAFLDGVSSQ